MRRFLDGLYQAAGYLSAAFLAAIVLSIFAQMICRGLGITFDSTEIAGFFLAASTFLGLAYTLRAGGHVRITLLVERLPAGLRRPVELLVCALAAIGVSFVAWHVIVLTMESWRYQDVSPGLMAVPFWLPQSAVALGITVFAIALVDELVWIATGGEPRYETGEDPGEAHYE